MWLVAALLCVITAVLGYAGLCRAPLRMNPVLRFALVGGLFGAGLAWWLYGSYGIARPETWAALLVYACCCELYIFLFMSVMTSISANLMVKLLLGKMTDSDIERRYDSREMVAARLDRLIAAGFLEEAADGLQLTRKGARIEGVFRRLRGFFHDPSGSPWVSRIKWRRLPWHDIAIVALLTGLAIVLFRHHIFDGGLYLGNPDRLNSNLKILKFQVDGLAHGHLDAWSEYEMLGYDTFALPYTFPSLATLFAYILGGSRLYITAGYESTLFLALAGIAAYAFLRVSVCNVFPAAIGAILYEFSSLTVLKVSQNDLSFAVFIVIPLLLLVIRQTTPTSARRSFLLLTGLIFLLLQFMFLQKASYALLLAGAYAVYRSAAGRDWRVLAVFTAACLVGAVGAFPRIFGIAKAINEYSRVLAGYDFTNFADVYRFQAIYPFEILRWFDHGIFGRFPSEAAIALHNQINMTEGFLLSTSSLVPFLLIFGLLWYRNRPFGLAFSWRDESGFFFWVLLFTFSIIVSPDVLAWVWWLYLRMDFTHARILIAGLLPLSFLVARVLADIAPPTGQRGRRAAVGIWSVAALAAISVIAGIEAFAQYYPGNSPAEFAERNMRVLDSAVARIGISGLVVVGVLVGIPRSILSGKKWLARTMFCALGLAIGLHTFLGADFQVNGAQTRSSPPFLAGNNYYATKDDFHPPESDAVAALRRRLDNDNYRAVLVCDPNVAGGFCAGHIPEFWRLRAVDGYYGLGVPQRLTVLPWRAGRSLRTISFSDANQLDWSILSLLNVKYAIKVEDSFYRNRSGGSDEPWRRASPDAVEAVSNPLPVVPRYFFARSVVPVGTASEAASKLFNGAQPVDVTQTSFVERFPGTANYSVTGAIAASGAGDRVRVDVEPAAADRFLVANELYFPGWSAKVDGGFVPIYPTNAVMRGVVVPAGVTSVEFIYTPFVRRRLALAFYGSGLLLLGVFGLMFGRRPFRR